MQSRARFMRQAKSLGHNTDDSAYIRVFVNFLLGRSRESKEQPTEAEWYRAFKDLSYFQIDAEAWRGLITGSTTPRKLWMEGFESRWKQGHPGEPLPADVFVWLKICMGSRYEIETKGSSG